jgi:hypothetical protein
VRVAQEQIESLAVGAACQVSAFAEGELAACAVVGDAGFGGLGRLGGEGDAADDALEAEVLMPPLAPAAGSVSPRSVLARRAAECSSRNWRRARRRVVLRADGGDGLVAGRTWAAGASIARLRLVLVNRRSTLRVRGRRDRAAPSAHAPRSSPCPERARSRCRSRSIARRRRVSRISRHETPAGTTGAARARNTELLQYNRSYADRTCHRLVYAIACVHEPAALPEAPDRDRSCPVCCVAGAGSRREPTRARVGSRLRSWTWNSRLPSAVSAN